MDLCSIQDCNNIIFNKTKKLCEKHYMKEHRENRPKCIISSCSKPKTARGYCMTHYKRLKKYGDPLPDQERIFKVPSGYRINNQGYAEIRLIINNRAVWVKEHRYLLEQKLGRSLKKTEQIHHKDGNKLNNNISNLELWVIRQQPSGQRVKDMLDWAYKILEEYKNYEM